MRSNPNESVLLKYCYYENMFLILIKFRLIVWNSSISNIINSNFQPDTTNRRKNNIILYYIILYLPDFTSLGQSDRIFFCFRRRSTGERLRQMFTKYCWVSRRWELFSVITHKMWALRGIKLCQCVLQILPESTSTLFI